MSCSVQNPEVLKKVLVHANSLGYARAEEWSPGLAQDAQFSFWDSSLRGVGGDSQSNRKTERAKISVGTDGTISASKVFVQGKLYALFLFIWGGSSFRCRGMNHLR